MEVDKKQQAVAVFRYALVAPALHMSSKERRKYFRELDNKEFDVPYYGKKRYRADTLRIWMQEFKNGGLDSLRPALRRDSGIARSISEETANVIKSAIERFPFLSCSGIYRLLIKEGSIRAGDFGETTLRKYIKRKNLRNMANEIIGRKKYEKENVNEVWISDFMSAMYIRCGKRKRRVWLTAIIDDHSRVIVGWLWDFHENSIVLAKALKAAISIYGLSKVFYCDNGSAFISGYLQLVCAKLGIALVHSKPYDSPSRGKIERFFKTVRTKFLASLDVKDITLEELNERFEQWLNNDYHKVHHSGINECPIDRYFRNAAKNKIKTVSDHELDIAFLNELSRKVRNDATVRIDKKYYEVPPEYIGTYVKIAFPIDNPYKMTLMDNEKPVCEIKPVNVVENANKPYTGIHFKNIQGGNTND